MIKGKITEVLQSVKPLFILMILAFPPVAGASPMTPIRRDSLRDVTFSGDCAVRQDSESRDGALEILISANRAHACVATLELNSPVLLGASAGLQFTARGTRPHQALQFEFARNPDDDVNLLRSPRFDVVDDWQEDAMRFSRLRGGRKADQMASIRIIAVPNPHAAIQPVIAIRGLRFVSVVHQTTIPVEKETPPAPVSAPQPVTVVPAALPLTPAVQTQKPLVLIRVEALAHQWRHSRLGRWSLLHS